MTVETAKKARQLLFEIKSLEEKSAAGKWFMLVTKLLALALITTQKK